MEFKELVGKTMAAVVNQDDVVVFTDTEGKTYRLFHREDCCESVRVEDVCGDLADLVGEPLLQADESTSSEDPEGCKPESQYRESFTWTFYRLATIKGSVVIRWLGESNGYYSESVDFVED